jgi:hypothetical protein
MMPVDELQMLLDLLEKEGSQAVVQPQVCDPSKKPGATHKKIDLASAQAEGNGRLIAV